ncbi:UDP-glucose/GDP-mannose dehydrogenase family protein [Candidatus Uhrbacteria bacterium]|nr:UDP-glucose/GDP-mannose dehydrogenase family protein [Candidatus Uhrbacteria bacterium]
MKIAIIGTGYVGLVSGADFASRGFDVVCVDIDAGRIAGLQQGVMPFFEEGLERLVTDGVAAGTLSFTTDGATAIVGADVVMTAVGTPLGADGRADLSAVYDVAAQFGASVTGRAVLVNKSTVPVGTAEACEAIVRGALAKRGVSFDVAVVSNPEFLSQGTAVRDTARPSRIIVGAEEDWAREVMRELNASFIDAGVPYREMSRRSAEMAKVAANAFLATKISFINEIANLCERTGARVDEVAESMGLDSRIGPAFLRAGLGYGGGCIPKDAAALIAAGRDVGYDFRILPAVEEVNALQRELLYAKLCEMLPERKGTRVAVWGLAFKPGTDDLRLAPALSLLAHLLDDGVDVVAFDPAAAANAAKRFPSVTFVDDPMAALAGADALAICTEWNMFSSSTLSDIRDALRGDIVLDGRGVFRTQKPPQGLRYWSIGCG